VTKRIFQDSQQQESYSIRKACMELKEHIHCTSTTKRFRREQSSNRYMNGYTDVNPFTKERIRHQESVMDNYMED
jgi:hypothetical protein